MNLLSTRLWAYLAITAKISSATEGKGKRIYVQISYMQWTKNYLNMLQSQLVPLLLFIVVRLTQTTLGKTVNEDSIKDNNSISDEARLVQHLLDKYSQVGLVARPTYNSSKLMQVQFGMRLIQMDIIEKEQTLKTSVWIRARWIDEYLRWNPEDFGGIRTIVVPWQQVWIPDVVLVNTAVTDLDERPADIMVSYHGAVFWSPHRRFQSACLIDVTNFPYDKHTCHMWFQSMSRYRWQLDLVPYTGNPWDLDTYLASFKASQEWNILENTTARYNNSRDVGVLLKFSRRVALRFTLTVQRRLGYTCHLLMLPCVFLGCMTLVVFCLPSERPDRHTLATSLFGSFMVLTLILVEVAPPTASSVPRLGMYYACNMSLVMTSIFLSGLVINVGRIGDRDILVPIILKRIFIDFLARLLLMHSRASQPFKPRVGKRAPKLENGYKEDTGNLAEARGESTPVMLELVTVDTGQDSPAFDAMEHRAYCCGQWIAISVVMDRLFFVLYVVALSISMAILFPRPS